jgi:hypothetical protein
MVLPCRPDRCALSSHTCLKGKSKYFSKSDCGLDGVALSSRRMQAGAVQKLLDTDGRPDASLGRPDGNKGTYFF